MRQLFQVGVTRDFLKPNGSIGFGDMGLSVLDDAPEVRWEFLAEDVPEITAEQSRRYDALLVLAPRVGRAALADSRLALVARFGVGCDNVDIPACTENGVLLTITPDGVRRPVAANVMTFILALSHKLLIKDRITREGRWQDRAGVIGMGLTGRTLGVIGLGNIGREVFRLAAPWDMRHLAADPFCTRERAAADGVELVELDELLARADFSVVCCSLTPETRHLIDARRIALMPASSFLINVARGAIVDQAALTAALEDKRIQGAGLDVFETEPPSHAEPLFKLDNVILTPHALCWTDECFRNNGRSACNGIVALAQGEIPENVVNRGVIGGETLERKRARFGR